MELNSNYMDINKYLIIPLFCFLSSCGGSSSTDTSENNQVSTDVVPNAFGRLIDSEVIGLKYKSGEYEGLTDENGEFGYILGEQIQFFVGDIAIGYQVEPKDILTPYELANNNSFVALNIARFLQSLDDDSILNNGIQIIESSHNLAKNQMLDFLSNQWEEPIDNNSEINQLVYLFTSETANGPRFLVSPADAYYHYSSTLDAMMDDIKRNIENEIDLSGCTTDNECKNYLLESVWLEGCTSFGATKYLYSEITTDMGKIEDLAEQRIAMKDIKSDLKNAADINNNTTGICIINERPSYPTCNSQQQCELSYSLFIEN